MHDLTFDLISRFFSSECHYVSSPVGLCGRFRPGNRNITKPTDVSSAFHKFRPGEAVEIEYLDPEDKLKTEIFLSR